MAVCIAGITTAAFCAERPDVTKHDAQYLDHAVSIHVEWQSPNPVTKVNISAGSQVKEVAVDEYDNRRNPYGYQGEVSVNLPVDPQSFQQGVPYVIQLEDDLRQKSGVVSGKAQMPGNAPFQHEDDNWGKGHLGMSEPHPGGTDGPAVLVDRVIGLFDRMDSAPTLDSVSVNILSPENVSFTTKANDDKSLQEIRVKVYNGIGTLVGFQALSRLGKVWQGTSQTFTLGGGSYRVVVQAVDNAGNTSPEQIATFQLTGRPIELQAVQEIPPVPSAQPAPPAAVPPVPSVPSTTPMSSAPSVTSSASVPPVTPTPPGASGSPIPSVQSQQPEVPALNVEIPKPLVVPGL